MSRRAIAYPLGVGCMVVALAASDGEHSMLREHVSALAAVDASHPLAARTLLAAAATGVLLDSTVWLRDAGAARTAQAVLVAAFVPWGVALAVPLSCSTAAAECAAHLSRSGTPAPHAAHLWAVIVAATALVCLPVVLSRLGVAVLHPAVATLALVVLVLGAWTLRHTRFAGLSELTAGAVALAWLGATVDRARTGSVLGGSRGGVGGVG